MLGPRSRQLLRHRTRDVRQLAALHDVDAVGALGEHALARAERPRPRAREWSTSSFGQPATTSYAPKTSWPPFSLGIAAIEP